MMQTSVRRAVALAGATVMAGATLTALGAGVATAAPVTATGTYSGAFASSFRIDRTVSNSSPTYGDTITVTTRVTRTSALDLLYGVRDHTPTCLERVSGTASGQASGGEVIREGHSQFSFSGTQFNWDGPGVGPWFTMETQYRVMCDAGSLATGGAQFASVVGQYRGSATLGPTIEVQRQATSVFLNAIASPQTGQTVTLSATTDNVPDGGTVNFLVDGTSVGSAVVTNGRAQTQWTPTTTGNKVVQARVVQSATHAASTSTSRTVTVSQANVDSTTTLAQPTNPQVGMGTNLTATVSPAAAGGTVTFREQGAVIGTAPVGADGTATINWIPSTAGERSIDADYSGITGVNPSTTGIPVTVAAAPVGQNPTTTTLETIPMVPVGQQVPLRASVSTGTAGGTFTFYVDNVQVATIPVGADGTAQTAWVPATEGEHVVRVVFSGSDTNLSSEATQEVLVTPAVVPPGNGGGDNGGGDNGGGTGGGSLDLGSLIGGAGGGGSLGSLTGSSS